MKTWERKFLENHENQVDILEMKLITSEKNLSPEDINYNLDTTESRIVEDIMTDLPQIDHWKK